MIILHRISTNTYERSSLRSELACSLLRDFSAKDVDVADRSEGSHKGDW